MSRRLYSPKIREDLIKPLYHYSQHLGIPMTKTVNRILSRGLLLEPLPYKSIESLPADLLGLMDKKGLKSLALEDGAISPVTQLRELSHTAKPYTSIDEVVEWYEPALNGLARGLSSLQYYSQSHSTYNPSVMQEWFYENSALNLGQTLTQTMTYSVGNSMPNVGYQLRGYGC